MNKKPCPHGAVLPSGLFCLRGYLIIQLETPQGRHYRSCRRHTKEAEKTAILLLNKLREQMAFGTYNLPQKTERVKFDEMARLWYQRHYEEYKDPNTLEPRSQSAKDGVRYTIEQLIEFFGDKYFDMIEPTDVKAYRDKLIEFDGKQHGTFNKHRGILSSIYSMVEIWVETKEMPPVKMRSKNFCIGVPELRETARDRVASMEELARLKRACFGLHDEGLWNIIMMELETTLRLGDLKRVNEVKKKGDVLSMTQGKTGMDIHLPAMPSTQRGQVFINFRVRWEKARKLAMLCDLQFRDLRRTGAHMLKKLGYSAALIKDTLGHKKESTTEQYLNYKDGEAIRPLIVARRKLLDTI